MKIPISLAVDGKCNCASCAYNHMNECENVDAMEDFLPKVTEFLNSSASSISEKVECGRYERGQN